tara:strand:+ start:12593 stop:13042 length:450 start_codon:yes stop_codon:yes gene_type:complete
MKKIGIVSGYFNPLHKGHIEYIRYAGDKCDELIVIINNDKQVILKNSTPFMEEDHRKIIVENIKGVTKAIVSIDTDKSVRATLASLKDRYPTEDLTFYNSGDKKNAAQEEAEVCRGKGIKTEYIPLPKISSSSSILYQAASNGVGGTLP